MALTSAFSSKKCLVVADSPDLARLFLHSLRQVGLMDGFKADDVEEAKKQLFKFDFDLVICAELGTEGFLEILRTVRRDLQGVRMTAPVVCFSLNWDGAVLPKLRDAGITLPAALPFSLSSLLKTLTRAVGPRSFIDTPSYRGPCRRLRAIPDYNGPRRRAADSIASVEKEKKAEPTPKASSRPSRQEFDTRSVSDDYRGGGADNEKDVFYGDPTMQQTKIVIDDACVTVGQATKLAGALQTVKTPGERADLLHQIADTTERMVNLLTLANARIQVHGCDDHLLSRLGEIKENIVSNTEGLAEAAARRATDYGEKILAKEHGFPLGAAELMTHQITRMDTVIQVVGGADKLSESTQKLVAQARQILKKVVAREAKITSVLPEIDGLQA
ncbi:Response regulator receiver [Rhodospirillaceae bacterium LM-1]|nr:Response regulator receiver [Rhodospirillaceae bacterium LM-1]